MTTLGQRIKEHRRRAGLSQEALARRMDVSRQAVTKWESGQSAPSTENLFRLAELFGTTVDLLLPSEGADAPAAEAPPPLWSRSRRRPRVLAALAVTAGYLVFYLLGRILWCPLEDSSLLGWLLWGGRRAPVKQTKNPHVTKAKKGGNSGDDDQKTDR